jgi:hypothetical protein
MRQSLDYKNCITMPLEAFMATSGMGRTKLYQLLAAGELQSVTIGKKRLVVVQSYLDFVDRQIGAALLPSPNPRVAPRAPILEEVDQPRRRRDRRIPKAIEADSRKLTEAVIRLEATKLGMVMPRRRRGRPPGSPNRPKPPQPGLAAE